MVENSKDLKFYRELQAQGIRVPRLETLPELFQDIIWIYGCFCTLLPSRNFNGRIPISEIKALIELDGGIDRKLTASDMTQLEFIEILQALDAVEVPDEHSNSKGRDK